MQGTQGTIQAIGHRVTDPKTGRTFEAITNPVTGVDYELAWPAKAAKSWKFSMSYQGVDYYESKAGKGWAVA